MTKKIKSKGNEVDPSFLQLFDFKLRRGNNHQALAETKNIILTESLAKSIFGDIDPLDKTIILDNKEPYKVSAVMQDLPSNTNFDFTYLIPLADASKYSPNWNTITFSTYVQLKSGTDIDAFNNKLINIIEKKTNKELKGSLFLYPVSKMHLYSKFAQGIPVGGKIDQVKLVCRNRPIDIIDCMYQFYQSQHGKKPKKSKGSCCTKSCRSQTSQFNCPIPNRIYTAGFYIRAKRDIID
jgi:putative ABC transport system permease protein